MEEEGGGGRCRGLASFDCQADGEEGEEGEEGGDGLLEADDGGR